MLSRVIDGILRFKGLFIGVFLVLVVLSLLNGVSAANVTDTTAPKVSSTDPANNAVQVPGDKQIKVVFNEPVKAGSNWIELKRSDGTIVPVSKSVNTKVLTVKPNKSAGPWN